MEEEMEPITQLMVMMKNKKKIKQHVCKFCNKCFPCGRSLGGHMRSHLIVLNSTIKPTISTSKTTDSTPVGEANNHNQQFDKPSEKSEEKDGDALLGSKKRFFCKECGKAFLSSKALFGHMKSHSENEKPSSSSNNHHVNTSLVDVPSPVHDSWTTAATPISNQKQVVLVNHSQSDDEAAAAVPVPRPKRSIRRPRYIGGVTAAAAAAAATASSSSLSPASDATAHNNNNNIDVAASSPVSDIEQEEQEEEVALSLIMLSKDLSQWGRRARAELFNYSSAHGSSDRNSDFLEDQPPAARTDDQKKSRKKKRIQATSACAAGDEDVMKKVRTNRLQSNGKKKMQAEKSSGCSLKNNSNASMVEGIEDEANHIIRSNDGDDNGIGADGGGEVPIPLRNNLSCASLVTDHNFDHYYYGGSKRKLLDDEDDDAADQLETRTTASALVHDHFHDMNILKQQAETEKRSKFECTTCNKVFYSYQALGGHRASHNKIKGSCSSTIGTSPKPYTDTKGNNPQTGIEISTPTPPPASFSNAERPGIHDALLKKKVIQKHECPICFKVFPSGQALGGHKRSHVIAGRSTNYSESNSKKLSVHVVQKQPSPMIRDFLDLNLPPAPAVEEVQEEEETASHHDVVGFKSWWAALKPAARGACGGSLQLIINGQEKS